MNEFEVKGEPIGGGIVKIEPEDLPPEQRKKIKPSPDGYIYAMKCPFCNWLFIPHKGITKKEINDIQLEHFGSEHPKKLDELLKKHGIKRYPFYG